MASPKKKSGIMPFILALGACIVLAVGAFVITGWKLFTPDNNGLNDDVSIHVVNEEPVTHTTTNHAIPVPSGIATFTEERVDSLVSATPANNAVVGNDVKNVSMTFTHPIGPASTMNLLTMDGTSVNLGRPQFSDDRLTMTTGLRTGVSGSIRVQYSVCSADNQQCTDGSYGFTVRAE